MESLKTVEDVEEILPFFFGVAKMLPHTGEGSNRLKLPVTCEV